ncbi:hypothetical protein QA649_02420 [Bradyrhizobium sp. CB1717]|uniref:hypothetical protein n=1 Tax=Bradyrhizobium sp. CB1717 TaxID=3039154 RepID=UPI0024B094BE|nr:hypothetical protein [Bradyrhizobium sp. CB1717]WFU25124.1 hypothetical protein QA649_02420 [Bradyrhizobium sp. CB1717]
MMQSTIGLLEKLRPPTGFKTVAALGTTYSADLLACMAVLTTMDGSDTEQLCYGRVEAYRALDRLRDKVRICYHAGRLSRRDGQKYPSLALLDRIVAPIRLSGRRSFHPKVWLVRQIDNMSRERFVLVVSSRNITTSMDWDLGIALEGSLEGGGVTLPRVRAFAEHVLGLAGEVDRLSTLGKLDDVRWRLPPHVRQLAFDFQAGGADSQQLHSEWGTFTAKPSRVLLLSPFIDERMVEEAAARWRHVRTRRLIAGREGLRSVALGPKRRALQVLEPREMVAASEAADPPEAEAGETSEYEIEQVRALHAKVIAIEDGRRATVIVGSNNLTGPGWCGGNTEAYVRLVGDASICDALWDWAGAQAQVFDFPELGTPQSPPDILEQMRSKLHAVLFRLEDPGAGAPSRLVMLDPPKLQLPEGVRMEVARYTTPRDAVSFPSDSSTVSIPACTPALRTCFVVCTLRCGDDETAWIAAATLDPPLGDERDRELAAQLLGLREFLAYLQSLRSDETILGIVEGDSRDNNTGEPPRDPQARLVDSVSLEGLLRQLVADPEAFHEMDLTVIRYGELIKMGQLSRNERELLADFLKAWGVIREAFSR